MTKNKTINKAHINRQTTKEHLKKLEKNSSASKLRSTGRIMKYGAVSFTRNVWLSIAATLVMTVTLVILMVTVISILILTATAKTMQEKIDISIYFTPETSQETMEEMAVMMRQTENVQNVEVTDSAAGDMVQFQTIRQHTAGIPYRSPLPDRKSTRLNSSHWS